MRFLATTLLLISSNGYACWKVEGSISLNNDKVEIHQKFSHDKTYSFQAKGHIFNIKMPSTKKDHLIEIHTQFKNGLKLIDVGTDKMLVKSGQVATMTKQDNKTGDIRTFTFKVTEI